MDIRLLHKRHSASALKFAFGIVVSAFLLPAKLSAQAPTVSYASPHAFGINVPGSLTPTSSNVGTPGYGSPVVLGTGLTFGQNGLAVDAAGNMYVADQYTSGIVVKISADGTSTTTIGTGFLTQSSNIALDQAGDVYVADQASVWVIPVSGSPATYGTPVVINSSFTQPFAIAYDNSGFLYVADFTAGGVYKMSFNGTGKTRIDNGLTQVSGLTVDAAGNVYACTLSDKALYEIPANGNPQVQLATGFSFPRGLAVDALGTVYVDDENLGIYTVPAGGGTPAALISGLTNLVGIAIDNSYNLYGAVQASAGINKFSPSGGYFISAVLPAGLTFNNQTGVISGTPTALTSAANYSVFAYNASGGTTAPVNIAVTAPPAISYVAPPTYTAGTAITALAPSSTGTPVTTPGYGTQVVFASGFDALNGITIDASGNLYISNSADNIITKIAPGGSQLNSPASFAGPAGMVIDKSGNIYVANATDGTIKELSADFSTVTTLLSGFTTPIGVALDRTGNYLFVADAGAGNIYRIQLSTARQTTFYTGLTTPMGMATDASGNMYVTDSGSGTLYKFNAQGVLSSQLTGVFSAPTAVAVDPFGNAFVADGSAGTISEVQARTGAATNISSGINAPSGVIIDGAGDVCVGAAGNQTIYKILPYGGYYINQPLPRGLKLNDTTGVISGTPKVVSAATDYTITGYANGAPSAATVNITINAAQPPAISYTSPQSYIAGTAITALSPGNAGGPVASIGYSDNLVQLGSGFSQPAGAAVDLHGNVYVADNLNGLVMEIPAGNGTPVPVGGLFASPAAVAVDSTGNVYVADEGHAQVVEIPAGGGSNIILGSGFTAPNGVAVDPSGNVFVIDEVTESLYKIPAGNGTPVTLASGTFTQVTGVAVDASDNVYVADGGGSAVYEYTANSVAPLHIGSSLDYPTGVAVDAAGNVYVADQGPNVVYRIPAGGSSQFIIASGLNNPGGISVDGYGNVYVADIDNNAVEEFSPAGGYFVNKPLPSGLKLSTFTGVISGTPTAGSPATNYIISAYNTGGMSQAPLSITVTVPPPPVIAYTTPQVYTTGTAITPLAPSSIGAAVSTPGYNNSLTTLASNFGSAAGVARDAAGNLYVTDKSNNAVIKVPAGGGSPVSITVANLSSPRGVAVDQSGNIYVADSGNGVVKEISADLSTVTPIGSGFINPVNVAFDPKGNLFIADAASGGGSGVIYEIEKATGKQSTFANNFVDLSGLATDAAGNVYVSDVGTGNLYKYTYRSNLSLTFGIPFDFPTDLAVDASGDVFVSDGIDGQVYELPGGNGPVITAGPLLNFPVSLVTDGAGNIYVTDAGPNVLYKLSPNGGYYVNQPLPRGLQLNDTTGVISGTPKAVTAATDYTITAYNSITPGTATVNITVNPAQPPAISYTGPQTYTAGIAITTLSPANSGGPVASVGYSDNLVPLGSGYSHPMGTAVDSHGNVYVADVLNNLVEEVPAGGGTPVTIGGTSFNGPSAVAVDSTGNVYVADEGNAQIVEIPAGGGANIILSTGFNAPNAVAVDLSGNVYVGDEGANMIYEIPLGSSNHSPLISPGFFGEITGIAVDALDNLYISDGGNLPMGLYPTVYKYNYLKNLTPAPIGSFFDYPTGVAVDAAGNVYVADQGPNVIYRIPGGGGSQYTIVSELNNPQGISIDGFGNVYIADTDNNAVEELSPNGGYYINKPLPSGLALNSFTGEINGTPLAASPAVNYIITAYNTGGGSQAPVSIAVNLPPPASVSYASPQVFDINNAISPVSPSASNVATPSYLGTPASQGSGFTLPWGTALDQSGNIYVADLSASQVIEILKGGGTNYFGSGLNGPQAVAVDKAGNVYVGDQGDGLVYQIAANGGPQTAFGSGFQDPAAIAVDSTGNVFIADVQISGGVIDKITPAGVQSTFASGFVYPSGLAVDASGNVYVTDQGSGGPSAVYKVSADGSSRTQILHFFNQPDGVAVDATGNLFISDSGNGHIVEYPAGSVSSITIKAGLTAPVGLAVDGTGNIYVADPIADQVDKLTPTGGYFVSNVLPAGLNLDATTGTISGTPTVVTPAKNYTISAYNFNSSASAIVNIKVVSTIATLSSLTTSVGTLSPVFASGTIAYSESLAKTVASITLTPTATYPDATITVNGLPVASGAASAPVILNGGDNVITVVVTAGDGTTQDTYTVTATKPKSTNAGLSSLILTAPYAALTTVSGPDFRDYTASVPRWTNSIEVVPVAADPNATITINGNPATSGSASAPISLVAGANPITIVVTAQDGVTTKTYTITVTRAPSVNATLTSLGLIAPYAALATVSGPDYRDYTASVTRGTSSIEVIPVTGDPKATITINGNPAVSGSASAPVNLVAGANPITIVVTAQDGVTKNTYVITVTRPPSINATLSSLILTAPYAPLTTVSGPDYRDYTASVPYYVSTIEVLPVTTDPNATITIEGNAAVSGSASVPLNLLVGPNTIPVVVTAQDGTTQETYSIMVTRSEPSVATLTSLTLTAPYEALTTVSGPNYRDYTASVAAANSSIKVLPVTTDPNATLTINGNAAVSGSASAPVSLSVGANPITIVVTAHDGVTTNTYVITVTRPSGVANPLDQISVTQQTETPALAEDGINVHQGVSPNGDGIEDYLQIDNIAQYPDNHLAIMNRNGELVYEVKGYDNADHIFDGHNNKNGQMQLPGTYFFALDYSVNGVIKHKTGFLVLKY